MPKAEPVDPAVAAAAAAQRATEKEAKKAERLAEHEARMRLAQEVKSRRKAHNQVAESMRRLKRTPEDTTSWSLQELEAQAAQLTTEIEVEAARAKEDRRKVNDANTEKNEVEAEERRSRSVLVAFNSEDFLNQVKTFCSAHGEVESIKMGVTSVGKVPEFQVRFKTQVSAKAMSASKKKCAVSLALIPRPLPSPARTVTIHPAVIEGGSAAVVAAVTAALGALPGVITVTCKSSQAQIEFRTDAQADSGLTQVNQPSFMVGGQPLQKPGWKGFARKLEQQSKKRKADGMDQSA